MIGLVKNRIKENYFQINFAMIDYDFSYIRVQMLMAENMSMDTLPYILQLWRTRLAFAKSYLKMESKLIVPIV